jgi:hypothetical protein
MTSALRISFEVACPVEHAFAMWTSRIGAWWPRDHTVTGGAGLTVVLEGRVGGRIFERTRDGAEHDWGAVTRWEPPAVLGYSWHLGQDAAHATDVVVRFIAEGAALTLIEIEHRGWERLGETAVAWRDRNRIGWETLLPHFAAAIEKEAADGGRHQG